MVHQYCLGGRRCGEGSRLWSASPEVGIAKPRPSFAALDAKLRLPVSNQSSKGSSVYVRKVSCARCCRRSRCRSGICLCLDFGVELYASTRVDHDVPKVESWLDWIPPGPNRLNYASLEATNLAKCATTLSSAARNVFGLSASAPIVRTA